MAVGLGRTIGNPIFLFFQIVHGVSLFFLMLGVARVALGLCELSVPATSSTTALPVPAPRGGQALQEQLAERLWTVPTQLPLVEPLRRRNGLGEVVFQEDGALDDAAAEAAAPPLSFPVLLGNCFHIPLKSLFTSPVAVALRHAGGADPLLDGGDGTDVSHVRYDGGHARFYLQHGLAALLCAYPLALLLQRRKFVLDFVVTIYVAYWMSANLILQSILGGGTLHWWAACALGVGIMYGTTYAICRRKEMQEVKLSGATNANATGTTNASSAATSAFPSTTATVWLKEIRGDEERDAEEMQPIFRDSPMPSGAGVAATTGAGGGNGGGPPEKHGGGGGGGGGGGRARVGPGVNTPRAAAAAESCGANEAAAALFKNKSV